VLSLFAAGLVVFFGANEIAMLPLYAIGVFLSFTLSQGGMIVHHLREKEPGWGPTTPSTTPPAASSC
jgi:hypothetical protein